MKVLLILAIGILTNLNNVYATNVAAGVAIYPTVEEVGQGAADVYWYNVISGVSTTTTTTFNPTSGLILILENGESSLNMAATEVQDALDKEELGLELNELDMAILNKLDELNL